METEERLELLKNNPEKSCFVLSQGEIIYTSELRGVRPLKDFYEKYGEIKSKVTVVDRVVGKGAAILAFLIGADTIVTPVISIGAKEFAQKNGIEVKSLKVVPHIMNRRGDGKCPIENAVKEIHNAEDGYRAIKEMLKKLAI